MGIVAGLIGVFTGASSWVGFLINAAGSLLMGGDERSTPDAIDTGNYAGQKIKTTKTNTLPVPYILGQNKVGSNVIYETVNGFISGDYNRDYYAIQVVSEGEIEQYIDILANDVSLTNSGTKWYNEYVHVNAYKTTGNGIPLSDVIFCIDGAGGTIDAGSVGVGGTINATTTATTVFHFQGIIHYSTSDNDYEMTFKVATPTGQDITGNYVFNSGISSAASSVGGYFSAVETYATGGWVGGEYYDAKRNYEYRPITTASAENITFSFVEIKNATLHTDPYYPNQAVALTDDKGKITVIQQPSAANGYTCKIRIDDRKHEWYYDNETTNEGGVYTFDVVLNYSTSTSDSDNIYLPANIAFLAVHQVYDGENNKHTSLDRITSIIKGKKIKTILNNSGVYSLSSNVYSENPAFQVLDKLMNVLSIPIEKIDLPSFYYCSQKCLEYGYTSNIAFIEQTNIQSNIQDLLSTFRGLIAYSQGKFKLKMDEKNKISVKTLTENDILENSFTISMRGFADIANKIKIKYINPLDEWLSADVVFEDVDLQNTYYDGQLIEKILDIKGITNKEQADKLAQIALNTLRYSEDENGNRLKQTPLIVSFSTTIKNADLEVGDVITVSHSLLQRDRKFIVLSVETDQSGVLNISGREYCETHFKNSSGVYII